MDLRLALYELTARHNLDARASAELWRLAGPGRAPAALMYWLPRGVAVLGAALGGLGLIFWIAANWENFGRFGRFALLQGFFAVMCAGALWRPAARVPLALLALLTCGGLFAYFGQTYQTGADPWQLFALWAALALPLCLGVRSDVLWMPWVLAALTAVSLWVHAQTERSWEVQAADFAVDTEGWAMALVLTMLFSPPLRRYTGAGPWALRSGMALSFTFITATGLGALFSRPVGPQYVLALLVLAAAAGLLMQPRWGDLFGLSAAALGLNALLVGGFGHLLFEGVDHDLISPLLVLGLSAAALLAGTLHLILQQAKRLQREGEGA